MENQYKDFIKYVIGSFNRNMTLVDKTLLHRDLLTNFVNTCNVNAEEVTIEAFSDFMLYFGKDKDDKSKDYIGITTLDNDELIAFESAYKIVDRKIDDTSVTFMTEYEFNGVNRQCIGYYISTIDSTQPFAIEASNFKKEYDLDIVTNVRQFNRSLWVQGYKEVDGVMRSECRCIYPNDEKGMSLDKGFSIIDVNQVIFEVLQSNCPLYAEKVKEIQYTTMDELEDMYIPKDESEEEIAKYLESIKVYEERDPNLTIIHGPVNNSTIAVFLDMFGTDEAGIYMIDVKNKTIKHKLNPTDRLVGIHKELFTFTNIDGDLMFMPYAYAKDAEPLIVKNKNKNYDIFLNIEGADGFFYGVQVDQESSKCEIDTFKFVEKDGDYTIEEKTFITSIFPNRIILSKDTSRLTMMYVLDVGYLHTTAYFLMDGELYSYTSMVLESSLGEIDDIYEMAKKNMGKVEYDKLEEEALYFINNFANLTKEEIYAETDNAPNELVSVRGSVLINLDTKEIISPEILRITMSAGGRYIFIENGDPVKRVAKLYRIDGSYNLNKEDIKKTSINIIKGD